MQFWILCFSAQNYSVKIRESSSQSPFFVVIWVELMTSFDSPSFSMMIKDDGGCNSVRIWPLI